MNLKKLAVTAVAVIAVSASAVRASDDNPFMGASISLSHANGTWNIDIPANADGSSTVNVPDGQQNGNGWSMAWTDVFFDADPFIAGNFAVTNGTGAPQTFTLTVTMPTAFATGGSTTIDGGTAITVADANGSASATMSTLAPEPVYSAEINGGLVARTLFDHAYSLSPVPAAFATTADFDNYFGEAGPAVALISDVTIVHTFVLSPGDRATVNSTFNIVPEPATMALLAIGAFAIVRRRIR